MKKIVGTLACLFVLCILVGTNPEILESARVLATENAFTAVLPLEYFESNSTTP